MIDNNFSEETIRKTRTVKVRKIYWDRIIIAFVILCLIIFGVVKLILSVGSKSSDKKDAALVSSSSQSEKDEQSKADENPEYSNVNLTVCIDAGHGDFDSGTINSDGTRLEKDDDLAIALLVEKYLKSYGVNVVMTRSDDSFLELSERCDVANNAKADLLVCLHRNSYDGDIKGVEIWVNNCKPEEDTVLANNIMTELENVGISENRGVQYGYVGMPNDNYYINADTIMPSCLVELGFLTDEEDNKLFDEKKDEYAKAISIGIVKTGIKLGVVDENGNRLMSENLISKTKPINNSEIDNSNSVSDWDINSSDSYYYADGYEYNTEESENRTS